MTNDRSPIEQTGLSRSALTRQVAIVTGAGRGIGRETALALAWIGARVVVAEINEPAGRAVEQEIRAAGGQAVFIACDVSESGAVDKLVTTANAAFGPVDILVNNAILCPAVGVTEMSVELWDRVVAVNLRGTFLTCRACLPAMLARRRGTIVNMVSTEAMPGLSAYIATKQGIAGFSQSLALEVGEQGVRVIPFGPGMVDTPGIRSVAPDLAPRLGLSEAQFLAVPLHPAFDGLMPADYAGAATAYLIAALADEFHGESVSGYTVLERAGLISPAPLPAADRLAAQDRALHPDPGARSAQPAGEPRPTGTPPTPSAAQPAGTPAAPDVGYAQSGQTALSADSLDRSIAPAVDLCRQLTEQIAAIEADFSRLPVFVRPLARSGFKSKAGQSLADWQRSAATLSEQAQQIHDGDSYERASFQSSYTRLRPRLAGLISYHQGVPAETARFSKDPALLREVTSLSQERIALIEQLRAALDALLEG